MPILPLLWSLKKPELLVNSIVEDEHLFPLNFPWKFSAVGYLSIVEDEPLFHQKLPWKFSAAG